MKRSAPIIAIVGGLAIVLLLALVILPTPPKLTPATDDPSVSLGPSRQRTASGTDVVARTARDALKQAAGATGQLEELPPAAPPTPAEEELLRLVNIERANRGLAPTAFDPAMLDIARTRAAGQLDDRASLSHVDAFGQLVFIDLLAAAGVPYRLAGENLARSSQNDATVVQRLHTSLMNSPTHRENILESVFDNLAIGAATDPSGRVAFAQIFRAG